MRTPIITTSAILFLSEPRVAPNVGRNWLILNDCIEDFTLNEAVRVPSKGQSEENLIDMGHPKILNSN